MITYDYYGSITNKSTSSVVFFLMICHDFTFFSWSLTIFCAQQVANDARSKDRLRLEAGG